MKKFIVFLFVLMLFIMSYKDKKFETVKKDNVISEVKPKVKKVDIIYNDEVKNIDLEDYVVGVVACEMPASFDIEALKAMSVAARTFAEYKITTNKNYRLSTTTKDQCYITKEKMKKNWKSNYTKNYNKILNME